MVILTQYLTEESLVSIDLMIKQIGFHCCDVSRFANCCIVPRDNSFLNAEDDNIEHGV